MQFFSETEYIEKLKPILRKIFTEDSAFGGVFAEAIQEKRIICSIYSDFYVDFCPPLSDAVIQAAKKLGDEGFYWTAMLQEEPRHCYLKFEEFNSLLEEASQQRKNFLDYFDVWDRVIYSPSSRWGVMISRDDGKHGLIAGNKEFVQSIESFIPDFSFEEQVH